MIITDRYGKRIITVIIDRDSRWYWRGRAVAYKKILRQEKIRWSQWKRIVKIIVRVAAVPCLVAILIAAGCVIYRIVSMLIGLDGCGEIQ